MESWVLSWLYFALLMGELCVRRLHAHTFQPTTQTMSNPQDPTHVVIHRTPPDPQAYRALSIASWILIILTCGLAVVPLLGFASWVIAVPVFLATFIMAIIILTRGGTLQGILLLLTSILFGPGFVAIAPFVSALGIGGAATAVAVHEESITRERTQAITGKWHRDSNAIITYNADGTFDIKGKASPVGRWSVSSNQLTLSTDDTTQRETIVSVSDTRIVTTDSDGAQHNYIKDPNQ